LQAMASHPKTQRRKPNVVENDVLPPVTIVDNKNVGPPTVTYVDSQQNIIPTRATQIDTKNESVVSSTTKNEIHVHGIEEKAQSRPEDEKEVIIYDDIYPRRVKVSQLRHSQNRQRHPEVAWRQQQQQQQQQRRQHESERRRRYFVAPPWRHPGRPPSAPPSASGSTRYFLPPVQPPHRPPHPPHNDEQVAENSVKSVVFPDHQKPPIQHPPPRYRQLVPVDQDILQDDNSEYDEYGEDYADDANRRNDFNWWLGSQPTRRNQERGRSHSPNQPSGGSNSLFRSMMGVSAFCLHEDIQFNCVLTPVCWMAGGETLSGCESMLYSCCVEPSIARKVSLPYLTFSLTVEC
jgi:hypothetical protein